MSDAGFLEAICTEPDEDAHRLVFADWLDDHGNAERAEFIRLQVALAKREDDTEAEPLRRREAELLRDHERTWRGELPELPGVTWAGPFRRGFIEGAAVGNFLAWRGQGMAILRAVPLAVLSIQRVTRNTVRRLARSPGIERVRGLDFPRGAFDDNDLEMLARACHLRTFSYASTNGSPTTLGPDARHIFATMPCFAGLRRLWLHNVPFGNGGAARLAGAPNLARIESLRLRRCEVTSLGAIALAGHAGWGHLRSLDLSGNLIRDDGCRAIASSPGLGELRELDLSHNNIRASGVTALARSMFLCRLHDLNLAGCALGDEGIAALATSTNLRSLRSLSLEHTGISSAEALTLLLSPVAQNLRWLNLRGVVLDGDAADALEAAAGLDSLRTLLASPGPEDGRLKKRFGDRVEFL